MTTEQKFNAAVNVIRSLPKNGSYQPSNDLMLRFYGYYKQATNGPCTGSRPAFWDLVGRAKYDAWKSLGDMTKQEAMNKYVNELHTIVETMSYSDKVANFLEAPTNELDSINIDDLELIAGDVLERVRSQPNSPLASREGSPIRFGSKSASSTSTPSVSNSTPDESDHSDDEYIDTIENPVPLRNNTYNETIPNGYVNNSQSQHIARPKIKSTSNIDISQEITKAVQSLRVDIEKLSQKVSTLESSKTSLVARQRGMFSGVSKQFLVFVIIWPFITHLILNRYYSRRN
ncbi:acyl-CoA-binding domain-containing protein 5 [Diorhabda sublineata]|uniref:acyl-CoA-binding domain-containing protein 5 n=1 Tax=Diorhabda sublineata TaxID=1163346 RepID=UPI0024E05F39|nr:acyl-CoA-binding domain-containing protein 5 [Diorhabda sublineata]